MKAISDPADESVDPAAKLYGLHDALTSHESAKVKAALNAGTWPKDGSFFWSLLRVARLDRDYYAEAARYSGQ